MKNGDAEKHHIKAPMPKTQPVESAQEERQCLRDTDRRSSTESAITRASADASLEVEVTPKDRGPHDHLPEKAGISSARSRERQERRQYVRYHRSRKRGGERKHLSQRQRRGGTLVWE